MKVAAVLLWLLRGGGTLSRPSGDGSLSGTVRSGKRWLGSCFTGKRRTTPITAWGPFMLTFTLSTRSGSAMGLTGARSPTLWIKSFTVMTACGKW